LLDGAKQSDLLNSINLIGATAGFDPSIAQDLDFYSVLKEQFGNGMLGSALTATTAQHLENKQAMAAQQQQLAQSQVDMNLAKANKDMVESSNAYERQV
jgi:flagellar basal body rod protein FlgB